MMTQQRRAITTMTQRALNRALLARQLLLARVKRPAIEVIEHLVGMQAQAPNTYYISLWSRIEEFKHEELSALLLSREVTRIALMRSTIHLVSARDCVSLRPIVQSVSTRGLFSSSPYGRNLSGLDLDALITQGRKLLEEQPMTLNKLGERLQQQWPSHDASSLSYGIRAFLPLVQVTPRGVWGQSGPARCTTAEHWLGAPMGTDESPEPMLLRYLAAFGPASIKDAQLWSGLSRLREVFERMRPRLITFTDERGEELFDLLEAPRPEEDVEAPARLIGEFDNLTLSHADRSRIIKDEDRKRISSLNGMIPGMILLDGFVEGTWKILQHSKKEQTLQMIPFRALSSKQREALQQEGARLLSWLGISGASCQIDG